MLSLDFTLDEARALAQAAKPMTAEEKQFAALHRKDTSGICNFFVSEAGGFFPFEKPVIQTDIWIPEDDSNYFERLDYAEACRSDELVFLRENMADLLHEEEARTFYVCDDGSWGRPVSDGFRQSFVPYHERSKFRRLTDAEDAGYRAAMERRDGLFLKRLFAYLKRYGLSKVTARTFWIDR
jgi:hypothetical protein